MAPRLDIPSADADADADADGLLPNFSVEEKQMQMQMKSLSSVWDCGSSLYDSFELSAFSEQLNRAIAAEGLPDSSIMKDGHARSVSMPHYTSVSVQEDHPAKTSSRFGIPKSVQRLFTRAFHAKSKKAGRARMLFTHVC